MKTESYPRKHYLTKLLSTVLLFLVLGAGITPKVFGQTEVIIGTGTTTSSYVFYSYYTDFRAQHIYTAAELSAAGACSGPISQIAFNVASYASTTMNGYTIKLGHTTLSSWANTTYWETGLTQVYQATTTITSNGWQVFTLSPSFTWDGVSNLVVELCFNNTTTGSTSTVRATSTSPDYRTHYQYSSSNGFTLCGVGGSTSRTTTRPNIKLFVTLPDPVRPSSLTAAPLSSSSNTLTFAPNAASNNVVIVANTTGTFTTPSGAPPAVGSDFAGGKLVYNGTVSPQIHSGLTDNTMYYYKAWSYDGSIYSCSAVPASAQTFCLPAPLPFTEGFEGLSADNTLPTCWSATNFGSSGKTRTMSGTGSYNRGPHTGNYFAYFVYGCDDYFFARRVYLTAGTLYKASVWYITDGYDDWNTFAIKYGNAANPAAQANVIASVSYPTNQTYSELTNTFVVNTSGEYVISIYCKCDNSSPWYFSWDDFSLTEILGPPKNFVPVATNYSTIDMSWALNASNDPVLIVANTSNTFGTPIDGINYLAGNSISGGGEVIYAGTGTSFSHTGRLPNTTYYYRAYSCSGAPDFIYTPEYVYQQVTTPFAAQPPTAFTAFTPPSPLGGSQIDLSWALTAGNPVIIAYNTINSFGAPVSGESYAAGANLPGGGKVIYNGSGTSFNHTGLNIGVTYYYQIFSYLSGPLYYSGPASANATTLCDGVITLPYSWDFTSTITGGCWTATVVEDLDEPIPYNWQAVATTPSGTYPIYNPYSGTHFAYYDAWDALSFSSARLETPVMDFTVGSPAHPFMNFYRSVDGSTEFAGSEWIQPQYSYDGGATWTDFSEPLYSYDASYPALPYSDPTVGYWKKEVLDLTTFAGHASVKVGLLVVSQYGRNVTVDLVSFKDAEPPTCASTPVPADGATGIIRNYEGFSWTPGTGDATGYDVYLGTAPGDMSLVGTATSNIFALPFALASNTTYYWQVIPKSIYYTASGCPVWSFTTSDVIVYCPSNATSTSDEDIKRVVFGTIDNISETNCNTYTDYTSLSTDVLSTFTYPVSLTKIDCENSSFYSHGVAAFIDFNQNGDFDLPSERVWLGQYGNNGLSEMVRTGSIAIPADALGGPTLLRFVLTEFASEPVPCGTYSWGETEDYMVNIIPYDKDLEIVSWLTPMDNCSLTANETVKVTYHNKGLQTQNSYVLSYYNGSSWVNETVNVPIASGETKTYTFTTPADFSAPGEYLCKAAIYLAGDLITDNDTSDIVKVRNYPVVVVTDPFLQPVPGDYVQNFDNGDAFWYPNGIENCWELGTPAKDFIDGAYSGDNAWVTHLTGEYHDNSYCWVESPCFDLSSLLAPIIDIRIKYQTEPLDGALVMANIDGAGWTVVGDLYQLTNWYNQPSFDGSPVWGGQSSGTDYILASHQIPGAGGSSNVKLGILFMSDGTNDPATFDGFAFDDIKVYESPVLYATCADIVIEYPVGDVLDLKIKGGVPPYNVLWSPVDGLSNNPLFCDPQQLPQNCQKPIATPMETTIYTAKVWDSKLDKAADTVYTTAKVTVYPQLIVDARWDATVCDTAYTQIYAMASGGLGPYTYQWDNVATLTDGTIYNPVATPTTTTTYTVTVTDALGFIAVDQVTITTVSGYPVVDIHPNGATICLGDAIQLTATGGTDYQWSVYPPSQAGTISATDIPNPWVNPTISGVKYTCLISSPCGVASDFVIINVVPKPVVEWEEFTPDHFCVYQDENIPLSGGTPVGGTYSGPGVEDNMFNPAIAGEGTHTITYTYINYAVNDCPNTATFEITVYPAPNVGLVLTDDKHCLSEEAFLLSGGMPTGGTYSGIGVEDNMFDPNLPETGPGVYAITYTYTDPETGCTATSYVDSLYIYPNPVVTWDWSTAVCISALPFELEGGMPEGGVYVGDGVVSTPNFDPAIAGPGEHTIYYYYTDDNGCSGTASSVITVYELPSATSTSAVEYTICEGETISYTVDFTGEAPWSLIYSIDGVDQPSITDIMVSPYVIDCTPGTGTSVTEYALVYVTDDNGCSSTPTETWTVFTNENPLPFHVVMNDPDGRYCFGTDGIAVGLHASQPGYLYELYKDGEFTGQTFIGPETGSAFWFVPNVFEEGTYTVKGYSNVEPTFCEAWMDGSVTIGIDTLDVNIWAEFDSICLGGTSILEGYIVNPHISAGPYVFTWAPLEDLSPQGFAAVLANPVESKDFFLTVSDADGCAATAVQHITVLNPPSVTINGGESSLICDGSGVALEVDVEFGDSDEIIDYLWTPLTDLDLTDPSAPIASPHVATGYTVVVVDGYGCEAQASTEVLVTPSPNVVFSGVSPAHICPGGSVQLPLVEPTIGSGSYSYSWTPTTDLDDPTAMNPWSTATQTTTYTVVVTDAVSDCSTSGTFTVIVNNELSVELGDNFDICLGTAANLFAVVEDGFDPLSFEWSSDPYVAIAPVQNPAVVPAAYGTTLVTVTVTDFYGCTATDLIAITAGSNPVAHAGPNDTICQGECTTLMGSGGTSYQWFENGLPISPVTLYPYLTVCPPATTTYELRVTSPCGAALSFVSVIVNPETPLDIDLPQLTFCQNDESVIVTGYPTDANGVFTGNGIVDNGDGTATFTPSVVGTYDITYTYTNQFECEYSTTQSVTVLPLPAVAFSDIADVCLNTPAFALTTGSPVNGTYSGDGVSGGLFDALVAGLGEHTLTYTVTGANGCTNSASITVVVNDLPGVFNASVSNGGIYCDYPNAVGVSITLDGSEPYGSGIVYSLVLNGFNTSISMGCTGSPIVFTNITAIGTYQVLATNTLTGCSMLMNGILYVDRADLPIAYNVTGGGKFCQGGTGVAVGLDNSNYGITYMLYRNNSYTGISHPGVNGPFDFVPNVTAVGDYTVIAVDDATGCEKEMNGSVEVSTYPLPFPYFVYVASNGQPSITVCPNTSVTIRQNANECGVVYELYRDGVPTGETRTCANGATFTWQQSLPGVYTVIGTRIATGCVKQMNGSATILNYEPVEIVTFPVDAYIEDMGDASFSVVATGYNPGYQWQVSQNGVGPWTSLVNDEHYTGVNASTLYVNNAPYDNWTRNKYRVVVSGPCNSENAIATLYIDPIVNVIINNVTDCAHDTLFVPITLTHCDSVAAISLTIVYDNTNFTFVNPGLNYPGYADLNPILNSSYLSILGIGNTIRISYFDAANSINNGYTNPFEFLKLGFKAANAGGTSHQLNFVTNIPGACELSKLSGEMLTTNFINGVVDVVPLPVITSAGAMDNEVCEHETIVLEVAASHPLGVSYTWAFPPSYTPVTTSTGVLAIYDAMPENTGTYYVTVTSSEWGCEATASFNVTVYPEPDTFHVILPNGYQACAGSGVEIALDGSELNTTYQLFLEPNNVTPVEVIAGTGLPITFGPQPVTGTYVVKATTVNGCKRWMVGSAHIQINPLPLWFNVTGGGHYCAGGNGREIRLSGSQLGTQYTLLLNACCCQADSIVMTVTGTGSPISFGYHLTPGYYSVVAVNPNTGCQNNMIGCIPIIIDPLPTAALIGGSSICYGAEATLTLNLTGKAPWTVVLNDGTNDFPVNATTASFPFVVHPTVTTTYTIVSVTDANNCTNTGTGSATITVWELPLSLANSNSPVCVGSALELHALASGFGPFGFVWTGPLGFTSTDQNPVIPVTTLDMAGNYYVQVTDGHGCVSFAYATVVINPLPVIGVEHNTPCVGTTLSINAFADGNGPFTYSWTGPNYTGTDAQVVIENVTAADAGDYTVTVTDANGCVNVKTVTITVNPLPVVICTGATVCAGESIHLTAEATGNGPFTYYWTGPGFSSNEQNPVIADAQLAMAGTYVVSVYDANQCVGTCEAIVIVNPLPEPCPVLITEPNVYCFGCVPPTISLGCSYIGITYTLYHNGVATTNVLAGTGQAISFGPISIPGYYTVFAVNNVTGCENWMYGTVEVIEQAPPTATLSGDEICIGENAEMNLVLTGDTYWNVVITDGVNKDTLHITGSPYTYIPGTGPHILAPTVTTTYTVLLVSDRVCYNVGNSATVVVNPLPNKYTMTGGGYYCNGVGVVVGLNGSQVGINYTLHQNGNTLGTVAGTGSAITFGPQADGVYWAEAINPISGCSAIMNGQVIVHPNPDLIGFDVTGGGSYCVGGGGVNVYLSGSQLGKEYKLLKDGIYTGVTLIGTGYALTFTGVTDPGVYTVLLFDPATTCTRTMNGSATVVQRPLPTASISGDATICYGDATTLHVDLTGTPPYTFIITDGINSGVHHTSLSHWDTIVNPTSTRDYHISSVVDLYCQNGGTGNAHIIVNSPTPFVVTGGGSYCFGGLGVVVGLSGSESGVDYTLVINGVPSVQVIVGTGYPISFGYQTVEGTYTVIAKRTIDNCSRTMNGVALVDVVDLPTIYHVTGGGACCVGCTHVFVCLDGSQNGIRYELYINGQYSGIYKTGNDAPFCYGYATVAGIYTIKAVDINSGCWAWMDGSATVELYPTAQANISGGGITCLGQSTTLTVTFTEGTAPFSFGLADGSTITTYNNITDNPYTITVTPTAGVHNYTLAWVSDVYGCYNNITTGVATVTVTSLPYVFIENSFGPYCVDNQGPIVLSGGHPTGGVYSGVGVENGNFYPALAGVGSHVITYTFTDQYGCQGFGTTTIVVYPLPTVSITQLGSYCVNNGVVDVYGEPAGGYFIGPNGLVDLGGGHAQFNPAVAGVGGPYTITYVYTYVPEPNNPSFGCVNSAYTNVSVVALPSVSFTGLAETYCVNDPLVELIGVPANGVFSGPGVVNGHFFDPAVAGVGGPYEITYTVEENYCSNSVSHYVTVLPLPQICTFEGGGICCIGCSVNGILNCASEQGVSYQLVRNGNLNIGNPKLGNGYSLVWEIFLGGTYQVVATNLTTHCSTVMDGIITVEIIPQPTATISGSATICSGQCAPLTVTLTGTPPFEIWLSNGEDTTVYHNIMGYTWTQDVCPDVTTTYAVVSLTDEYCGAFGTGSATITVNPMPEVFNVTGGGMICANSTTGVAVGLDGSQAGVYYELFLDGVSTGDLHLGDGQAFNFGTNYMASGIYTVKSMSISTCQYPMNGDAVIDTYPITDVTIEPFADVCVSATPFTLNGGYPFGGVYYVDGIEISYFDPQAVGVGAHVISYEYTDGNGCTFSASTIINVNGVPYVSLDAFAPVCFNTPAFTLTGGQPAGGIYYVNGIEETQFDPSAYGVGSYTITYVYTDGNGCTAEAEATLTVLSMPIVELPQFSDVYLNSDPLVLTGGTPTGGVYSGDHVVNGIFYPEALGTFVITYTFTDNCGTYSAQSEITVIEGAIYNITGNVAYDNVAATAMNNTTVYLKQGVNVLATTTTDADGDYAFNLIAPGTYTVSAASTKAWGGVNSNDALLIMKHYVGITPLYGIRLAAADVNGQNGVNSVDALLAAMRFVHQINTFPQGDWVFEVKTVTIVNTDAENNFKALCYGDVNGSYTPPYVKTPATINLNTVGVKEIKSFESFELPINVTNPLKVGAISLVISYPENLVDVEGVVVNGVSTNFLYTAENGELRISWYNTEEMTLAANDLLLTLKLRSRNISSASAGELSLSVDGVSELGDRNAVVIQNVNLTYPKLVAAVSEYSISNYPNPFTDVTEISYILPESGKVTLKVYNLLGEVVSVLVNNVEQNANTYKVTFDGTNLVSGIYTYKIEVNGESREFVKSGMMILNK